MKYSRFSHVLPLLLTVLLLASCVPQGSGPEDPALAEDGSWTTTSPAMAQGVHVETLPNGLTLILKESHASPVVAMQAWIRFGSMYEEEYLGTGLAHYIEHMIFKGTEVRGVGDFERDIRGSGGELNAYTTFDRTVLYMTVSGRHVATAMDAMADVLMNSTFDPDEARKEKDVIYRELQMGLDDPSDALFYMFSKAMWPTHPRGNPIIGYADRFLTIGRDDLVKVYDRFYSPNNLAVIMVGDFDTREVLPQLREIFSSWKRGPDLTPRVPADLRPVGTTFVSESHENASYPRIMIGWPTCEMRDPAMYPLDVFASVLGHGRTSRLYKRLVVDEELASYATAGNWTPDGHWGFFYVQAELYRSEDRDRFIQIVQEELEALMAEGVTDEELARAVKQVEAGNVFSRADTDGLASSLGSGWLIGDLFFEDQYVEHLAQVTSQDIRRETQHYLSVDPAVVATLYPADAGGQELAAAEQEQAQEDDSIRSMTLDNGIRVVVKRNASVPEAEIRLAFLAGTRFEPQGKEGVSSLLASLLDKGTETRSADDIFDTIESVGGGVSGEGGRHSIILSGRVLSQDVELALDLLSDMARHPRLDPDWIERMRQQTLKSLEQRGEDTYTSNYLNLIDLFFEGNAYSRDTLGTPDSVGQLNRDDLQSFARSILTPDNCVVSVVGDVSPDEVAALVERYLGDWSGTFDAPSPSPVSYPQATLTREMAKQGLNVSELAMLYPAPPMGHEDEPAIKTMQTILSGMGGRLFTDMRDHQALAYRVGCYLLPGLDGSGFLFYISPSPHENGSLDTFQAVLDQSRKSFLEHVATMRDIPVSAEELDFAKRNLIGVHEIRLQSNGEQATSLALDTLYGMPVDWTFTFADRVAKVTVEDIQRVARTYLQDEHMAYTVLRPVGAP